MCISKYFKPSDKLYYIGGIVRDEILGKKSFDIDLTYEGNAIEFVKNIEGMSIIKVNEPFGTVRVNIDGEEVDIASTRAENYEKPGHLPTVTKIGCSLKEDVSRRDFTINAMAKHLFTGEIVDYTGGLNDITNKKLRVLHDNSFIDDPTRIIRALKFSVRFNFLLEEHTKKLRDSYLANVNYDMSFKRVKKELVETFNLNSQRAYEEFIDCKIYKLVTRYDVVKSAINIEELINKYKNLVDPLNIWLIYVGTIDDISKLEPTLTRDELKIINDYKNIRVLEPKSDYDIYKMFVGCNIETILLYAVMKDYETSRRYLDNLMNIKISICGKDLQMLGIKPSSKYKDCFDYVLKSKLATPTLTYDEEIELCKKFFNILDLCKNDDNNHN